MQETQSSAVKHEYAKLSIATVSETTVMECITPYLKSIT